MNVKWKPEAIAGLYGLGDPALRTHPLYFPDLYPMLSPGQALHVWDRLTGGYTL
jgi:hypothetical protein